MWLEALCLQQLQVVWQRSEFATIILNETIYNNDYATIQQSMARARAKHFGCMLSWGLAKGLCRKAAGSGFALALA